MIDYRFIDLTFARFRSTAVRKIPTELRALLLGNCNQYLPLQTSIDLLNRYVIGNSLVWVHMMFDNAWYGIQNAFNTVDAELGMFVNTFSPIVDDIKDQQKAKMILNGKFLVSQQPVWGARTNSGPCRYLTGIVYRPRPYLPRVSKTLVKSLPTRLRVVCRVLHDRRSQPACYWSLSDADERSY